MAKKYIIRLSSDERGELEALIKKGKAAAYKRLHAQILLKADISACNRLKAAIRADTLDEVISAFDELAVARLTLLPNFLRRFEFCHAVLQALKFL